MNINLKDVTLQNKDDGEDNYFNYKEGSDYCHNESSYHNIHSSDDKEYLMPNKNDNIDLEFEGEIYSYDKNI
jgi:hypothetical protein